MSTTDVQRAARHLMAAKLLSDAAKLEGVAAKELLADHMRQTGAERLRVSGDDATDLGTVTLTAGRTTARVVDEMDFLAWVANRHPDELMSVVGPGFRERLLAACARAGDPVDAQGEVIPGVQVDHGEPYLTVRPTQEAKDRMRTLLADTGVLALDPAAEVTS